MNTDIPSGTKNPFLDLHPPGKSAAEIPTSCLFLPFGQDPKRK
jgi:hypothetical protein